jgi:hypothetical protein
MVFETKARRRTMTHRTRRRLAAVALAPAAALATWTVTTQLVGVDLDVSTARGEVGPVDVVVAAVIGALAGWLAARVVERHSRRPRAWWGFIASTTFAASTVGPSWLAEGWSTFALTVMHFVTAAVVILCFLGTIPVRRSEALREPGLGSV